VAPVGDRERIWRIRGRARARRIPRDDRALIREIHQLASPHTAVAEEPVQQYQRRALPHVPKGDGMSAHLGASQLSAVQRRPPNFRLDGTP